MAGLIIIAHAPLATALKAVAEHAFPNCGNVLEAFDVPADMPAEEIEARVRLLLARVRDPEALIFTDTFGATPSNVAQRLADGKQVKVIAGVNVPMLWRTLGRATEPLDTLVSRALAGAAQDVRLVASSRPQNQTFNPGGNDQDKNHDQ